MEEVDAAAVHTPKILAGFVPVPVLPVFQQFPVINDAVIVFHVDTTSCKAQAVYPVFLQCPCAALKPFDIPGVDIPAKIDIPGTGAGTPEQFNGTTTAIPCLDGLICRKIRGA